MTKKIVPQINKKNGVSVDYWNEFFWKRLIIENSLELKEDIRINPIRTYSQYFSEKEYLDVINSKNKVYIDQIDEIVNVLNRFGKSDLSIDDFERLILEAHKIIYLK